MSNTLHASLPHGASRCARLERERCERSTTSTIDSCSVRVRFLLLAGR